MPQSIDASSRNPEPLNWKDFSAGLKVLWDKEGSIQHSLDLIAEHPEHQKNTGRTGRRQILRVWGEDRLISEEVIIPEQASSAVFKPIPNRVMYCVYSTPVFNSNGYSTRSRGVASGLKDAGADVVVVARAGYPWDWKIDSDMPKRGRTVSALDDIDYVHLPNGAMDELSPSAHIEQAADAFVQEALIQRPQFIQAASNYRVALPALIAARRLGIPFVYEVRGLWEITGASNTPGFERTDRFSAMRDYESRVARAADHVFAITTQVKSELVSRGVESSKISLAPNAVDPKKFIPTQPTVEMAVSLGLEPGVPVIGFAGSIVKYEGLQTLLEASEILHERGIKHQLALAGSGNTEKSLRDYCHSKRMDWVRFLGRIPQDQVPVLLSVSDIIVTPRDSTVITELVSALKPLEAFSAGRAVVLSDVAPNIDLAGTDGSRAKVFAAGNAVDFADKIEELISNPVDRVVLAKTAREWIENERNWPSIGAKMFEKIKPLAEQSVSLVPDIEISELRIGLLSGSSLIPVLKPYFSIIELGTTDTDYSKIRDLDLMIVDISQSEIENRSSVTGNSILEDAHIQPLLAECQRFGIPRLGLAPEGIQESNFRPENAPLLDVCLTGTFEGVVEMLGDPRTVGLRVGTLPPILEWSGSDREDSPALTNLAWVADSSGVKSGSIGELVSMLDPANTEPIAAKPLSDFIEDNRTQIPLAIYIRKGISDLAKREIISKYSLDVPLVWEEHCDISNWFGDAFAEGVNFVQFVAGLHQWSISAEKRTLYVDYQRAALLPTHTLTTRLVLILRSLGIPAVARCSESFGDLERPQNAFDSSFGPESQVCLLRERACDLAPIVFGGA